MGQRRVRRQHMRLTQHHCQREALGWRQRHRWRARWMARWQQLLVEMLRYRQAHHRSMTQPQLPWLHLPPRRRVTQPPMLAWRWQV